MVRKVLMTIFVVVMVAFGAGMLLPVGVVGESAANCNEAFLTFRPWYYNLTHGSDCTMLTPYVESAGLPEGATDGSKYIDISVFVWTIILNVLSVLFSLVGYLALGFIIYGGYLYVLARGDTGKIAKGKRTVTSAIVGLIICILASLIVNTIVNIITGAAGA